MARDEIQSVRGMYDVLPPDSAKTAHLESASRDLFERYGYREIRTPIVESTALFARGIGEVTDVVEKQMYTFPDQKGRSLTLRPEMTAGCVRSYIEHAVAKKEPVTRWYYIGPMFRYERVQTGRQRQFHQIGVEAFGAAEPTVDAEQIAMLYRLYESMSISELDVVVNTVGSDEDRDAYRSALLDYLRPHAAALCADCQRRLEKNPLRVLDCKTDGGSAILAESPSILDHLAPASLAHFDGVKQTLTDFGLAFRVDPRLVRGLDYYTATVFEIIGHSANLGTQATLVGGGRYDKLVEGLGGPPTPAVGFALGVERAVLSMSAAPETFVRPPDVFIMALGDAARRRAMVLANDLRGDGFAVEIEHRAVGRKGQFKRADKLSPRFIATIDDESAAHSTLTLRGADKSERQLAISDLAAALR